MESAQQSDLILLTDLPAQRARGISYPSTVESWRWLYRKRDERGLSNVFHRVGRRVLIDVPAYLAAIRRQPAG